jgi:phospholipid N-methyltransferase
MNSHALKFLVQWVRNPARTAAILPSSKALANLMTAGLSQDAGRVLELGGGTGAFTEAILERGVRPGDLTVIEINPDFARHLRRRFAGIEVLEIRAEALTEYLPGHAGTFGTVISGLPIIGIPWPRQKCILEGAFELLEPAGEFVQFTYGPRLPIRQHNLRELGLAVERRGFALGNVPPASVYCFSRAHSDASP